MKIMFYALRPFDEQQYCEPYKARYGIDYTGTPDVPRPDNLHLAEGCDAVSTNPCEIRPEYLQTWAEMGVKYLPCRSIGYDHIPLDTAKNLGLRISHSHYPPDGVANYTIMLMLMCTRRMNEIMLRANVQDYSLPGKMGRDISGCTVGVIGTGKIGQTVIRHLSGFGCKIWPTTSTRTTRSGSTPTTSRWTNFTRKVTLSRCTRTPRRKTTTSSTPAPLQK